MKLCLLLSEHFLECWLALSAAFQSLCNLELSKTVEVDFQPPFFSIGRKIVGLRK